MQLRLFALVVIAATTLSCVPASNRFDPSTDPQDQARARLTVVVTDVTKLAVPAAEVTLTALVGDQEVVLSSDEEGRALFEELVPGEWQLRVTHPAFLPVQLTRELAAGEEGTQEVTLGGLGDEEGIAHLTGVVQKGAEETRPESAQDHSGVVVELTGTGLRTVTNAGGSFDLFAQPGSYTLALSARDHVAQEIALELVEGDNALPGSPLVLATNPGAIVGQVEVEGAAEGVHADVLVTAAAGVTTMTAADGSFRLAGVAPGLQVVSLAKADFITASVTVDVIGGLDADIGSVALERVRAGVTGVVDAVGRSDDGGVNVSLTGTSFATVTAESGAFQLTGVPTGSYELVATRDGFLRSVLGGVTVDDDGVDVGTLTLVPRVGDFEIDGGAAFTTDPEVTLSLEADGAASVCAGEDPNGCSEPADFVPFVAELPFTLSSGDGAKTVFVTFQDAEGTTTGPFQSTIVYDTAPPEVPAGTSAVVINQGAAYTNSATGIVSLLLTVSDATSGVTSVQLSADGDLAAPYVPFANSAVFTLADALNDGEKQVFARFRDAAGNTTEAFEASIILDREAPSLTSFTLNAGREYSTASTVKLGITGADADTERMALSTVAGFPVEVYEPFGDERLYTLAPGDGPQSVYLKLMDQAGNKSDAFSDDIIVDTAAPGAGSVEINEGDTFTTTRAVTVALSASGATFMRVAADGVLDDEAAIAYAVSHALQLPTGDGFKRVVVSFLDDAGNESAPVADVIVLDTQPPATPSLEVLNDSAGGLVSSTTAALRVAVAGAETMRVRVDHNNCATPTPTPAQFADVDEQPYTTFTLVTLPPNLPATNTGPEPLNRCKWIQVAVHDRAGNPSAIAQVGVELDALPPDAPRLATSSQVVRAGSLTVALAIDSVDHNFEGYEIQAGADVDFEPATPTNAACLTTGSLCSFNVALVEGENRIRVRGRDLAGNASLDDFVIVRRDNSGPVAPSALRVVPGDQRVSLSWEASSSDDVAGYLVHYGFDLGSCASPPAYNGDFAAEGPSGIDVGLNTAFRLTGLSNNIPLCVAVQAYDETTPTNLSTSAFTSVTPTEVGLRLAARLTSSQLGLPTTAKVRALALRNGLLYAAVTGGGSAGGLLELDVSNEDCFELTSASAFADCTGLVNGLMAGASFSDARDLVLHGAFAFVADGASGVRVFEIVEGSAPVYRLTIPLAGGNSAKKAASIAASQNTLAVGRSNSAIRAVDGQVDVYNLSPLYLSTPAQPTYRGSVVQDNFFGDPGRGIAGFLSVDLEGNVLAAGSRLYSVPDTLNPPSTFSALTYQPQYGNGFVALSGKTLYSTSDDNGVDNDLRVVDLAGFVYDADSGTFRRPVVSALTGTAGRNLVPDGPYLWAAGNRTLEVYDVSDRASARFLAAHTGNGFGGSAYEVAPYFGDVAPEGARAFFTTGLVAEIDVLHLGDPAQMEAVSSEGQPTGSALARVVGDAIVQPRTLKAFNIQGPEAVVHPGQQSFVGTPDHTSTTPADAVGLVTDGTHVLILNSGSVDVTARADTGGLVTKVTRSLAGRQIGGGALSWPYVLLATRNTANNARTLDIIDLRTGVLVATRALGSATGATAGGVQAVSVYGGYAYVGVTEGVFGTAATNANHGIYRMTFNGRTGALGAATLVAGGQAVVSTFPYGRRLYYVRNNAGARQVRVHSLASPATWNDATVTTLANHYPYEHTLVFQGSHVYFPADIDGMKLFEQSFDGASYQPTTMTLVAAWDIGGDTQTVLPVGDRVYVGTIGGGWMIFRTR